MFRRKSPSHDNEKGVEHQVSSENIEPKIRMSFVDWTKKKEFEYRLLHKYEDHAPHCSYVLVHKNTEAASKASVDIFTSPTGERSWMLVPNSKLLRFDDVLPVTYHCSATKVAEVMRCFKSVIPSHPIEELMQISSTHIDEQDAKVEEMIKKLDERKIESSL